MKGNDIKMGTLHEFKWEGNTMAGIPVRRDGGRCLIEVLPTTKLWVPNRNIIKKVAR